MPAKSIIFEVLVLAVVYHVTGYPEEVHVWARAPGWRVLVAAVASRIYLFFQSLLILYGWDELS